MTKRFRYTKKDLWQINWWVAVRSPLLWFVWAYGLISLIYGLYLVVYLTTLSYFPLSFNLTIVILLVSGTFFLLLFPLRVYTSITKTLREDQVYELTITKTGIGFRGKHWRSFMGWPAIKSYRYTRFYLLFFQHQKLCNFIPRHIFTAAEWADVQSLFLTNAKKYQHRLTFLLVPFVVYLAYVVFASVFPLVPIK